MAKADYKELVAQAEKAVSCCSDPALKQIAFQKVLDDLLNSTQETEDTTAPATTRRRKARAVKPRELRGAARGGTRLSTFKN